MIVINTTQKTLIGDKIDIAHTDAEKNLGLIPRNSLNPGEGLIINPCSSIHMYNMKFSIDVLFVDKNNRLVYLLENFNPWQTSDVIENSQYVIELPVGTIKSTLTQIGDSIKIYY